MTIKQIHEMKGQTLVIVALSLFALIALVALAIDGGNLMAERRQMQNAADAGALAGARAICAQDPDPEEQAALYATQNGAQFDVTDITIDGQTAEVIAGTATQTYFAGLIGFHTVTVRAEAAAACGTINRACNFMPVAFEALKWDLMMNECGREFIVIDSDKLTITDTDGDGIDEIISTGGRGWLRLPPADPLFEPECSACHGADSLKCWAEHPYPGQISLPACIREEPGTMNSAFEIWGKQTGKIALVPLHDGDCDASSAIGCSGNSAVHIIGLGCVRIVGYDSKYPVTEWNASAGKWQAGKVKALFVQISCDPECFAACAGTGGDVPGPGDVTGVSLLK